MSNKMGGTWDRTKSWISQRRPSRSRPERDRTDDGYDDEDNTGNVCSACLTLQIGPDLPVKECDCCCMIERGRKMLSRCSRYHRACRSPAKPPLPPRVLDVGIDDNNDIHLHESVEGIQKGCYVALSYCWGNDKEAFVTTTTFNIQKFKTELQCQSLPKTLQDVVYITRRLGIRYLWIDALCIMQDSEEDWTRNSAQMGDVYGNATVTLSASGAASCTVGILLPRLFTSWDKDPKLSVDEEPINHRAWTLQERLLSRRCLTFGKETAKWQCRTNTLVSNLLNENMRDKTWGYEIFYRNYHISEFQKKLGFQWQDLVTDYTARNLTKDSDKLPALSGIVRRLQRLSGDEYLAGLWKGSFFKLLLWSCDFGLLYQVPYRKLDTYRAPSWSWASVEGNVGYNLSSIGTAVYAELIDCVVEPLSSDDPFGRVKSGTLVLRGPLKQAFGLRWASDNQYGYAQVYAAEYGRTLAIGRAWPDVGKLPPEEFRRTWESRMPWCLQIGAHACLLLERVGTERDADVYVRVGVSRIYEVGWFHDAPDQTVTIV